MRQSLPALNALRAFEAAARHASMAKAAEELFVSPSALSHQIRGPRRSRVKLFERRSRQIVLTVTGKALYPGLHLGFQHILDAVDSLRTRADDEVLVVSTPPAFAAKWLAPRLYRFAGDHPDLDIRCPRPWPKPRSPATAFIARSAISGRRPARRPSRL